MPRQEVQSFRAALRRVSAMHRGYRAKKIRASAGILLTLNGCGRAFVKGLFATAFIHFPL